MTPVRLAVRIEGMERRFFVDPVRREVEDQLREEMKRRGCKGPFVCTVTWPIVEIKEPK